METKPELKGIYSVQKVELFKAKGAAAVRGFQERNLIKEEERKER